MMMTRLYPERPLVGVGAVVIHEGSVLLVRRSKQPCQGEWTFPGGVVELGETTRNAAERETLEETGIVIQAGDVVEVVDSIYPDATGRFEFHYAIVDFLCVYLSGEPHASSDVEEVCWIPLAKASRMKLAGVTAQVLHKAMLRLNLSTVSPSS